MQEVSVFDIACERVEAVAQVRASGQFDYGLLDEHTRSFVQQKTEIIRRLSRTTAARMLEIGKAFYQIQERLPRGLWVLWIEYETDWPRGSVHKMVQVYKTFGDLDVTQNDVPVTVLQVLARKDVPDTAKEEARERIISGQPLTKEIASEIIRTHAPNSSDLLFIPTHQEIRYTRRAVEEKQEAITKATRSLAEYDRTLSSIQTAVLNLRMTMADAYGVPIAPRAVRDALNALEQLVGDAL